MLDIKEICQLFCDECGEALGAKSVGFPYTIGDGCMTFCCYECAEQFVNNYNVDYAERKADERKYDG